MSDSQKTTPPASSRKRDSSPRFRPVVSGFAAVAVLTVTATVARLTAAPGENRERKSSVPVSALSASSVAAITNREKREEVVQSSDTLREKADKLYGEQSYRLALEAYQAYLKVAPASDSYRSEAERRIVQCLLLIRQWDEALARAERLAKETTDPLWKARYLVKLGEIYRDINHSGWKIGEKTVRGDDYPKVKEGERPQRVWLAEQDVQAAVKAWEQAVALYEGLKSKEATAEHAALARTLAENLSSRDYIHINDEAEWKKALAYDWTIEPLAKYDPQWRPQKKILTLYRRIAALVPRDEDANAAAALLEARYVATRRQAWQKRDPQTGKVLSELPIAKIDPRAVVENAARKFPRGKRTAELLTAAAQYHYAEGRFAAALKLAREIIDRYAPKRTPLKTALTRDAAGKASPPYPEWEYTIRSLQALILDKTASVEVAVQVPPGTPTKATLYARNLKETQLEIYRVNLAAWLREKSYRESVNLFGSIQTFGTFAELLKKGERLHAWTIKIADQGDYVPVVTDMTLPDAKTSGAPTKPLPRGSYLIVLRADNGKIRQVTPHIVTDLALVRRNSQGVQSDLETPNDRATYFAANAVTGEPVPGADVQVRKIYHAYQNNKEVKFTTVQTGETDGQGVLELPTIQVPNPAAYSHFGPRQDEAIAVVGDDRIAIYSSYLNSGEYSPSSSKRRTEFRAIGYTDRPLYRPRQTVHYRVILTQRERNTDTPPTPWAPRTDKKFTVVVNSPKNEKIYEEIITSSKFGTINGTFNLPPGAPLGEWRINLREDSDNSAASFGFRVEEYRKPEFAVSVKPVGEMTETDKEVQAAIKATYFYGAPVPNGRVTFKVYRIPLWDFVPYYGPFDLNRTDDSYELFNGGGRDRYGRRGGFAPPYDGGETKPIAEGTTNTDADGNATVKFVALPAPELERAVPEGQRAYQYRIAVEVMDSARRVVEAEGIARTADRGFKAEISAADGFYESNKGLTVSVAVRDVYGKPLGPDKATDGTATLLEVEKDEKPSPYGGYVYRDLPRGTLPVKIGTDGNASVRFSDLGGGVFKVRFDGKDSAGRIVSTTSNGFFVHGPREKGYPITGMRIIAGRRDAAQGDTVRLMVALPNKDGHALITQETGLRSIWTKAVKVDGYSAIVEMPTKAESVPNVLIGATRVKDFDAQFAATSILVKRSLARAVLTVKPEKETYRPGEQGTMLIKATDTDGKPLSAEVSLAVFDAALLAILPDRTPDLTSILATDAPRYISTQSAESLRFQPDTLREDDDRSPYPEAYFDSNRFLYYRGERGRPVSQRMTATEMRAGGFGGGAMPGGMPAPASSAIRSSDADMSNYALKSELADGVAKRKDAGSTEAPDAPVRVRTNLADLAYWTPAVVTDAVTGEAKVSFTFPDNLTEWEMKAAGLTEKVVAGVAEGTVVTDKKLTVRLAAPRFFVERDTLTLSAVVRNDLDTEQTITVKMNADPTQIGLDKGGEAKITLKPKTEGRVEFPAKVVGGVGGNFTVRATALCAGESDAVEQTFPALAYGVQKMLTQAGTLKPDQKTQTVAFDVPKAHKAGSVAMMVTVQPGLATTLLDALPYLADYPYGCVEQTMSRFLPAVLVSKALQDSGADLKLLRLRAAELRARAASSSGFGQSSPTNAFTDQTGYTYPSGRPNSLQVAPLADGLYHSDRWENPVFDADKLGAMQQEGMTRLLNAQRSDGGWGWWPGAPSADAYMTAYVMYGLASAKQAGVPVPQDALNRGYVYLDRVLTEDLVRRKDWHEAVWTLYALSIAGGPPHKDLSKSIDTLFAERANLTVYGKALLTLALVNYKDKRAAVLSRNLRDAFEIDAERGTATPTRPAGVPWYWWRWYCDDEESVAWALRAFTAVKDDQSGADELPPLLVRYLVDKKRGSIWRSTKSTALIVHALAEYLKASGELTARSKVTVALKGENGADKLTRTFEFTPENALLLDREFLVPTALLGAGKQTVTITREGTGKVYWNAACQFVTQEEKIAGAGDTLQVTRRYFRLLETGADVGKRVELKDGEPLRSGDKIEVEMTITAKNELDYVLFEDMKPAGYEPLEQLSGFTFGEGIYAHSELRDTKVAFFVTHLPRGVNALRYRLRAETPGVFHALPTNGYAMYAPDVRALSNSETLTVRDVEAKKTGVD